jgi:chemotaxis protein CheD
MTSKPKTPAFNPAVLPMEYLPRIPYASDERHARIYLVPGKIFVAAQPFAVSTIVGSGVTLCMWDSAHQIGGINHFMLPEGPDENKNATRYGSVANPVLLQKLLDLGAEIKTLEAKIFGGSLPSVTFGHSESHLGQRNVETVTHFLNLKGVRLVQRDVGGTRGRKVIFQTDDGRTWTEQL